MTMRALMNASALCTILVALGGPALAQVTPPAQAVPGSEVATPAFRPILAQRLIGTTVRDSAEQKLGSVHDLVIGPSRRVEQFVLSVGGLLGVGDKLVMLPVASFSNGPDGLMLRGTTKEALKLLPDFDRVAFTAVEGGRGDASSHLASAVIGADVRDATGRDVAAVDDLVIGPDRRIEQIVLSVGGLLGLGDKLVALPASEFRDDRDGLALSAATRESLEAAPAFDKAVFAAVAPASPRVGVAPKDDKERQRADYQAEMDGWSRRVSDYRDRAVEGAEATGAEIRDGLDRAWEKVQAEWESFKNATAETYEAAKARLDRAMQELDRSWQETTG